MVAEAQSGASLAVALLNELSNTANEDEDLGASLLPGLEKVLLDLFRQFVVKLSVADSPFLAAKLARRISKLLEVHSDLPVHCRDQVPQIENLLATQLQAYPENHEVQAQAQWALVHLAGIQGAFEAVRPVAAHVPVKQAFYWAVADAPQVLCWSQRQPLVEDALQTLQAPQGCGDDANMHRRCFKLIGARLRPVNREDIVPSDMVATCVQALAYGAARWVSQELHAASEAVESLWHLCIGSDEEEGPCWKNEPFAVGARAHLAQLEQQSNCLYTAFCMLTSDLEDNGSSTGAHLVKLLASVGGLARLVQLLQARPPQLPGRGDQSALLSSEHWTLIFSEMERHEGFSPEEFQRAVNVLLQVANDMWSVDGPVRALGALMDKAQGDLRLDASIQQAFRQGAEGVLNLLVRSQEGLQGRWPAKSAKALRAAALADPVTRDALKQSVQLHQGTRWRLDQASQRKAYDKNVYKEVNSTLDLADTLWGAGWVLQVLQSVLDTAPTMESQTREVFVQAACRVLADTENALDLQDARCVVACVQRAQEVLGQAEPTLRGCLGPLAQALGHALNALGASPADEPVLREAVGLLAIILRAALEPPHANLKLQEEISWGLCEAMAVPGGRIATALVEVGAEPVMVKLVEDITQEIQEKSAVGQAPTTTTCSIADTQPLSLALEALGRLRRTLGYLVLAMSTRRQVQAVQIAGLSALKNLLDDGVQPSSPEEAGQLGTLCSTAEHDYGIRDEGVRVSAQRIMGLLGAHTAN